MANPIALRDHLLASLRPVGSPHKLGLTVLVSQPKRTSSIFPHTPNPPRCLQQEILVVLSTDLPVDRAHGHKPGDEVTTANDQPGSMNAESSKSPFTSTQPIPPRVLICAISAYLYTFPPTAANPAVTPSSILYISKVDSSGYAPHPIPLTRHLTRSFFTYFLLTVPRIRIQLFARAQKQYLFANSAEGKGKKVLSGTGLCRWWKGVYEDATSESVRKQLQKAGQTAIKDEKEVKLRYILPGYDVTEARTLLGQGRPLPAEVEWTYRPPFAEPVVSAPLAPASSATPSLATLIPSLPDDPKTRFLEELVADSLPQHPKRSRTEDEREKDAKQSRREREAKDERAARTEAHAALAKISPEEFWERIGFRQECASGDVTGFFTLEVEQRVKGNDGDVTTALSGGNSGVAEETSNYTSTGGDATTNGVVTSTATASTVSTNTADHAPSNPVSTVEAMDNRSSIAKSNSNGLNTASNHDNLLPPAIVSRLLTALTNLDFASLALAKEGSELWLKSTRSLVQSELGEKAWDDCIGSIEGSGVIPPTAGVSASSNGLVKSASPGAGAAGGAVENGTLPAKREEPPVTMLQPRKKKK